MRKKFFSVALLCSALWASGQVVTVGTVSKINLPSDVKVSQPTISPDGSFVVVSDLNNPTLKTVDLKSGKTKTLTANGSGRGVQISADGSKVVYRQSTVNNKHLRYSSLKSVDVATGAETELVKPTRNLDGFAVNGNNVVALEKRKMKTKNLAGQKATRDVAVSIERGHLNVTVNGKTTTIDPQGRSSYLWPQLSPDGTMIVYWAAYLGCFVCNLDGSNPISLGEIRAARWIDNNTVVGQRDTDNGEVITASELVAANLDGKTQVLTDGNIIALNPTVSADGSKIAFSTADGQLYLMNISK